MMEIESHDEREVHQPSFIPLFLLLALSVLIIVYFFFCGVVLARIWYYQGALSPRPQKFPIQPQYKKERARRSENASDEQQGIQINDVASSAQICNARDYVDHSVIIPRVVVNDVDSTTDPIVRANITEDRPISNISTFVQDDCGDGSHFPNVPYATTPIPILQRLASLRAYPETRRPNYANYHSMGLRNLDVKEWLTIDNTYNEFNEAREWLLIKKHDEVIQVKAEGEAACEELLNEVVQFLAERYPEFFKIITIQGRNFVRNEITASEYSLQRPWDCHPLELCARLAMEDFNIIVKGEFTQQHCLQASATLFPAGWILRQRIGKSITSLHEPVPKWEDKLSKPVEHYFARLSATSAMERSSFFIQVALNNQILPDLLFIQDGKDFFPGDMSCLSPSNIIVRRERQTFRNLPKSGAIVFGVKTNIQKLTELGAEQRRILAKEIRSWPEDIARYKGRDLWQEALLKFCEGDESIIRE